MTVSAVDHLVLGWFRRAGVAPPKGALAHSLRHTYATLLVEQSGSVPEIQWLLGHANLATTQAYIDVAARGVEETAMANPARRMSKTTLLDSDDTVSDRRAPAMWGVLRGSR